MTTATATQIAELNDRFRKGDRALGKTVGSSIFSNLTFDQQLALSRLVRAFDDFTPENDPYREHDFGSVEFEGDKWFWKIDYFDQNFEYGSENPSDPTVTQRVLTIMHSSEY
ncbi:MAG: DUF3768 domain-containing protein [Thermosynechococcaceae cyanobacterium MS004]|nr:DUF3768 domain-containing protein [Thermosynechococcaceae cyanobacterium MS004]